MSDAAQAAVLVVFFNRPGVSRVLEALRAVRPARVYLAADGPRPEVAGESELCARIWDSAVRAVDWPCDLRTRRGDKNLGSDRCVPASIDWFFQQEERGIIFEDDCVPDPTFFRFCDELLERYARDERVGMISGNQFVPGGWPGGGASYAFVRLAQIWGWATWRRAWKNHDPAMRAWPAERQGGLLQRVFSRRRDQKYWTDKFQHHAEIWDYQWCFARWRLDQLGIVPDRNLVSNIGFQSGATHTIQPNHPAAGVPLAPMEFPLRHPATVTCNDRLDEQTARLVFSHGGFPAWWKYQREQRLARWLPGIFGR
jgi:hypothetical protein